MYVLRFFFDYGGTCLWAANDPARERFGYTVDLCELPIADDLRRALDEACARFDTRLKWDDPAGPLAWSDDDRLEFERDSDALLAQLRDALGSGFQILDQR